MAGRAKDLIAADVQKLITHLSGFSEKDDPENFELCEKFAYSNLLHHRYLSVDSHAVRRSVFGMVTKFMIHGHLEASRRLDCLLNKYMNSNAFKDKEVHWAVLSLLVKLADNPTSHINDEKFSAPKVEEKEDTSEPFDWTTYSHLCDYLKEGNEEFDTNFQSSSSDSSDWEDLSETDKSCKRDENNATKEAETPHVQETEETKDIDRQQLIEQLGRRVSAEEWLSNNVQKPWWNTKQLTERVDSVFPSANLSKTWDKCCNESTSTISEYKVVREILWMLQAPTTTTLFQEINGQFAVQSNITIPSLTKDSMTCYLNPLCEYFNMLYNLQKFQKEIYPLDMQNPGEPNQKLPPYTFECYTSSIIEFLRELQELACCIEKKAKAQEDIYTLYSLNLELAPKLSQLRSVYIVHVNATNGWKAAENWLSSARLLSVLYSEALACMECDTPCILLRMFLKSFRPYVDMIDVWLTEGRLDDYRNEFIITKRNETGSENWGSDFILREYVNELNSVGIRALPLLQVIADRVLHAGCSMQLLQQLDRLADMRSQHTNCGRMYTEFLEALEKEIAQMLKNKVSNDMQIVPVTDELGCHKSNVASDSFVSDVTNQLENIKDNYMMQAFKDYLPFRVQLTKRDMENLSSTQEVFRRLATYSTCGLIPIKPVMERIISQLIDAKHAAACFLVKTIFLQEFNLSTHLALIRAIYLMEAGDIMHRFCVFIFKDADHSVFWANSYVLTAQLEECINLRYPDHSSKFSVVVKEDAQLNGTPSVMDEISVKYTVDWPLSVILSPVNMEYYNSVFQFLLKVKWALWALEELRFSDLTRVKASTSTVEPGQRCHARCLQLLRFWLLHSVGSVHTYLMGQVLHSLGLELERDLAAATDLDMLLQAHNRYVALVHTHCLQPQSSDVIKAAILQMVQLSLELRDLWHLGVDLVSDAKLIGMTEMYIKCHCFLGSVLQTAVENSRLTHCASLASFSSPALKESNLFSDHMKYSLAFLAWQKDPPSGIIIPLPKSLHKYLEKGVWNEKRSDTNLNTQKLEIFLDNYFLFLSKRKMLMNSKGRNVYPEITSGISGTDNTHKSFHNPSTSRLSLSRRSICVQSSHLSVSSQSTTQKVSHPHISTKENISSSSSVNSRSSKMLPIENELLISTKQCHQKCVHGSTETLRCQESCQGSQHEVTPVVHVYSCTETEVESKERVLKLNLLLKENKDQPKRKYLHSVSVNAVEGEIHPGVAELYHNISKTQSSSDEISAIRNLESCTANVAQPNEIPNCCERHKTSEKKENERGLLLNQKTLKNIRQKCVRPNIRHYSKNGRKFYECIGSSISNVGKVLKSKTKASSSKSDATQYDHSFSREKNNLE